MQPTSTRNFVKRTYRSAFLVWASVLVPAGMYGLNRTLPSSVYFLNPQSAIYGLLTAVFLACLCKGVVLSNDTVVISRFAGLWRMTIPFAQIRFAGYVDEGRSYSLTIDWNGQSIRIWPLTCFGMDELTDALPIALADYRTYIAEKAKRGVDTGGAK